MITADQERGSRLAGFKAGSRKGHTSNDMGVSIHTGCY